MIVVSPDHDFGGRAEIVDQRLESFDHVLVADIPGGYAAPKHGSVVALGVLHQARILFSYEKFVGLPMAVAARQVGRSTLYFHQLADDLVFTTFAQAKTCGVSISLTIFAKVFKARIAIARPLSRLGIDFFQELDYEVCGSMQAVQIKAVESTFLRSFAYGIIVPAKPGDKIDH